MENQIEIFLDIVKMIFMCVFTYITNFKIIDRQSSFTLKGIYKLILIVITSIICAFIRIKISYLLSIISIIVSISLIYNITNIGLSMLITIISLSFNYIISTLAIIICFLINKFIPINSRIVILMVLQVIHIIILYKVFRMKKFRHGFSFLRKEKQNEYFDVLLLNISVILLFSIVLFTETNITIAEKFGVILIIFPIIMFLTIQKSLQSYYKQKLLAQELEETKAELEKKEKEVADLEAENIAISKKSHTLVHKQKALEYKLEEIINKTEISKEEVGEVRDRIKALEKDLYKEKTTTELDKTEIPQIDDMLKYMQTECNKNKIDFELQTKGNIHYMTNNLIAKEDLETLLADHIKNAIIAINHTDNVNRSILVRLGEIDGIYSLYIYDSGIEFEKGTLENLGKKPSTTHKDEGGTGMGFMNTFDTLRKCNASLIIEEINKPSKDNYTKAIIIKFDRKNEFKIISYR